MMLRGYRSNDVGLLSGPWLPGELLGLPVTSWPALAAQTRVAPPTDDTSELCVVPDTAFVRFADIDWVHRRARLEIGVRTGAAEAAKDVLKLALAHGFRVLNLRRLYGWVTSTDDPPVDLLADAGLVREAAIPAGIWLAGRPVERQIWGVLGHE